MARTGASIERNSVRLNFDRGTLVLAGARQVLGAISHLVWDDRTLQWRSQALHYRNIVSQLQGAGIMFVDHARAYQKQEFILRTTYQPRQHQAEALKAWMDKGARGVVALPTGAGKSILAVLAVSRLNRPTLIVVPTIDLMVQWVRLLENSFTGEVGALGGGQRRITDLTVTTYDSAALGYEQFGNRFGLVVFDECHHLPAPVYAKAAAGIIAPFRLGLSATIERTDGRESLLDDLIGPVVYQSEVQELVSSVLAPYDVRQIEVPLSETEWNEYQQKRQIYIEFIRKNGIRMGQPEGWQRFLMVSARSKEGRAAFRAYLRQKKIAQSSESKLTVVWELLMRHREDRIILFTTDNEFAYRIGREFILPVLTHQTRAAERKAFLEAFRTGELSVLVTSRVLNEGVDVPEANVAVIVSGTGAVREHVQRLGRILRYRPGKRALLYELVSAQTNEISVSERRRSHHAYQGFN